MCIWKVAEEDRRCEYCSYINGCEKRRWQRIEPIGGIARKYIRIMSDLLGKDVLTRTKRRIFVWGRYMIIYKLRRKGYVYEQIGGVMGMDHSSVVYGFFRVDDMLHYPHFYDEESQLWEQFNKNIELCGIES